MSSFNVLSYRNNQLCHTLMHQLYYFLLIYSQLFLKSLFISVSLCPCKYSANLSIIVNICVIYFRRTAVGLLRYFSVRYIFIRKYFRTKVALGKRCYYFGYFMLRVSFYVQQCIISWVPLGIDNLISNLSEYHYYSHTVIVTAKNIA